MDIEANKSQNTTNTKEELPQKRQNFLGGYLIPFLIGIDVTATHLGYGIPIAESFVVGSIVTIPFTLILLMLQKSKKSIFYSEHRAITLLMLFGMVFVWQSLDNTGFFLKKGTASDLVFTQIICGGIFIDLLIVGSGLLSKLIKEIEK